MKLTLKHHRFKILIYNSTLPQPKLKEHLNRYGYHDIVFISSEDLLVNTVKGLEPRVVIMHHHDWNDTRMPALIKELRKNCDTPVLVWSDDLNEIISRKFLSFKNTYTLRTADGFIMLAEILQRIELKSKNPLWV